jgi:hypothetical protein
MGISWNPQWPRANGPAHIAAGYAHRTIDTPNEQEALRFRALRTGAVDDVDLYAGPGAVGGNIPLDARYNGLGRPVAVDLYPAGSEPYTIASQLYLPTAITGVGAVIDETFGAPTVASITAENDGRYIAAGAINAGLHIQFDTAAFPLTRRVHSIVVGLKINTSTRLRRLDVNSVANAGTQPWFYDIPAYAPRTTLVDTTHGEAKVENGASEWSHFTAQDIRDFRSTGPSAWRVTCIAGPGAWKLDYAYMRVFYSTETRLGLGFGVPTPSAWVPFELTVPAATGAPSLVLNNDYTLVARRIVDYSVDAIAIFTAFPWRQLRGFDQEGRWRARRLTVQPLVGVSGVSGELDGIPAARFNNAGSVIADAQPYHLQRGAWVYGAQDVTQAIPVTGAATSTIYGQAYVFAGWNRSNPAPEGPLRCEVLRQSDGVRVFSPVEISAADANRLPRNSVPTDADKDDQGVTYRLLKFRFPESQALASGNYLLRCLSPDTSQDRAWRVGALIAREHITDQTYGDSTLVAEGVWDTGSGPTNQLTNTPYASDAQMQLVEVPGPVTGVSAAVSSQGAHHAEVCGGPACVGCADETLPTVVLTWSAAPSGVPDVAGYQIDRLDTLAPDWERVAAVWGRTNTEWVDQEARISVQSQYRLRVIRTDDVTGDWSDPAAVTLPAGHVALALSSNAATGMGVVYPEVWSGKEIDREWHFAEVEDVTLSKFYGRNRRVAFRPMERAGDDFKRTVLLNAGCTVDAPTMDIFRPLRDLAWAPVPYVCVRDGEGNRWFATLLVDPGNNVRPGERWLAEMRIVEVADRPAIVDTTVPQVTEVPDLS